MDSGYDLCQLQISLSLFGSSRECAMLLRILHDIISIAVRMFTKLSDLMAILLKVSRITGGRDTSYIKLRGVFARVMKMILFAALFTCHICVLVES